MAYRREHYRRAHYRKDKDGNPTYVSGAYVHGHNYEPGKREKEDAPGCSTYLLGVYVAILVLFIIYCLVMILLGENPAAYGLAIGAAVVMIFLPVVVSVHRDNKKTEEAIAAMRYEDHHNPLVDEVMDKILNRE